MKWRVGILCGLLAAALLSGQELMVNGDFEQELPVGWSADTGGSGTHLLDRGVIYEPDPDWECQVYQYDNPGFARLRQVVAVPQPVLLLSFRAELQARDGSTTCWPAACFDVGYLDAAGGLLGKTRFYRSEFLPWSSGPTFHVVPVSDSGWQSYQLNLAREIIEFLPGVDLHALAQVEIALLDTTDGG